MVRIKATIMLLLLLAACEDRTKDSFEGRDLVNQGRYREAIPILITYLDEQPQGRYASRSGLFLGKAYLGLGDLAAARRAFEETSGNYAGSLEDHKSRYKLAVIDLLQGHRTAALARFRALADDPQGPLAPEARAMANYLAANIE